MTASVISSKAGMQITVQRCCSGEGLGLYDDTAAPAVAACTFRARAYRDACGFIENLCHAPIMLCAALCSHRVSVSIYQHLAATLLT